MKCYICDAENFHSFEKLHTQKELLCCKDCGAVMVHVEPQDEEKMKEYYRKLYRPIPNHFNLITTNHKINYIRSFLSEFLKDKKGLVCADIGCATGYVVAELARQGHKAIGCEYTLTYRRFCEHFYGIPIPEELPKVKYDLITIYHVLEHMIQPDNKLKSYVDMLKDDGRILISTPEWYNILEDSSGNPLTNFEDLWHKDHINVFSRKALRNLFKKCHLVVESFDDLRYGQTYLLRKPKQDEVIDWTLEVEDWKEMVEKTIAGKKALELLGQRKYQECLKVWPMLPEAYLAQIFTNFGKDIDKQTDEFEILKGIPKIWSINKVRNAYGLWLFQQQRYPEAIEHLGYSNDLKPNEDVMIHLGIAHSMIGDKKKAMDYFFRSQDMNPLKWQEAMDLLCKTAADMQTWDEVAKDKFIEQILPKFKPELKFREDNPIEPVVPEANNATTEKVI
jgi:2-polyprenyl-3-methyl-5-hydroxy-6-metoxy-1,4-benzoquinol methylase